MYFLYVFAGLAMTFALLCLAVLFFILVGSIFVWL